MLKRLELVGFKSFADRTWFDFPSGLTAIVGPNGSGKSNIVDAVRWILGEQSAKSLRGGEMADVIFNGSLSRKGLSTAEVTMVFDNAGRSLNTEMTEVSVTRRVYRDGTGEYLINGQVRRLKDVRELFLGSGAGSSTYCIIEQGRVDAVLQASTKDRRAILEEAAGISRFKAKKIETLRKLDHTHENLVRLKDIQGEVEARLRRVRLDAEKARKFREYSARLRELRLSAGIRDYDGIVRKLAIESGELGALRSELSGSEIQTAIWDEEIARIEHTLLQWEEKIENAGSTAAEAGRRRALLQERRDNEATMSATIEAESTATMRRWIDLRQQLSVTADEIRRKDEDLATAESIAEVRRLGAAEREAEVQTVDRELSAVRRQLQEGRDRQFHLVGRAAALNSEAASARTQIDKFHRERDRKRRESEAKSAELQSVERRLAGLGEKDQDLQQRLSFAQQTRDARSAEQQSLRRSADETAQQLETLRVRRGGLTGRIEILENLERTQEGLNAGVREIIAELGRYDSPLRTMIVGLTADSLRVPREVAPLVDLALGERASSFVVRNPAEIDAYLLGRAEPLSGRVLFEPLQAVPSPAAPTSPTDAAIRSALNVAESTVSPSDTASSAVADSGSDGSVASPPFIQDNCQITADPPTLDRWVSCDHTELVGLPVQLLGRTMVVDDLAEARVRQADSRLSGMRFVTRRGELLHADGSWSVGPRQPEAGIVSRKSELRELRDQAVVLDRQIADSETRWNDLREGADALSGPIHGLEEEIRVLSTTARSNQTEIVKQGQQKERLTDELALLKQERELIDDETGRLQGFLETTVEQARAAETEADQLRGTLETAERSARTFESSRALRQEELTAARVASAEAAQRVGVLRESRKKLEEDRARGTAECDRVRRHVDVLRTRADESQLAALRAESGVAEATSAGEAARRRLRESTEHRDRDRDRRAELHGKLQSAREQSHELVERMHGGEIRVRDLEHRRDELTRRLAEDYQVDLSAEHARSAYSADAPPHEAPDQIEAAAKESDDLRKKIRHLGNVSLESLDELAEIEARAETLQSQMNDLVEAEQSLRAIIDRINDDSRKLFQQTYDTVRGHFQELFRKLFGGGMADIVLDNPEDVLESGIDVMARPPGKELRGITLMSGGEKTLTAVALLLAIFRSKPSPFCLLDEVDAALDEANTERLANTLRDFTDHSQFIVITHKKRTMAYADVLYGITMQESGVSKQIAVRFEDWPDEEEKSEEAAA